MKFKGGDKVAFRVGRNKRGEGIIKEISRGSRPIHYRVEVSGPLKQGEPRLKWFRERQLQAVRESK